MDIINSHKRQRCQCCRRVKRILNRQLLISHFTHKHFTGNKTKRKLAKQKRKVVVGDRTDNKTISVVSVVVDR